MLRFRDMSRPWGRLTLFYYRGGKLLSVDREKNVITNVGKDIWIQRSYNLSEATGVDRMEAGDGGCDTDAPATPIAFTAVDTDLRSSIGLAATLEADPAYDSGSRIITYVAVFAAALADPDNFHSTPRVLNEFALKTAGPDNITLALRATKSYYFDPSDAVELKAVWEIGMS